MTKDTRKRFTFRIPTALYEAVEKEANEVGVSVNAMILKILWEWVNIQK